MPHHQYSCENQPLRASYDHIYLSPHLDDAAISCGGALAQHCTHGQAVLVVNVCTRTPPLDQSLSPFAQKHHDMWGLRAEQAMMARQREDRAALALLGADSYDLGALDAIYRCPQAYTDNPTLFGAVSPEDPLLPMLQAALRDLVQRYPRAAVYAPLAVGGHVDHQIAYVAAAQLIAEGRTVALYEDIPYVCAVGALDVRLQQLVSARFSPQIIEFDAALERKITAIGMYASQLEIVFGAAEAMPHTITAYAASLSTTEGRYGERLWIRANQ